MKLLVSEPLNIMHVLMGPTVAQEPSNKVQRLITVLRRAGLHPKYSKRTTDGGLLEFYEIFISDEEYERACPLVESDLE